MATNQYEAELIEKKLVIVKDHPIHRKIKEKEAAKASQNYCQSVRTTTEYGENKSKRLIIQVSGATDIGSASSTGATNQDTFFISCYEHGNIVLGVFDGHGKELGALAAQTAKALFETEFKDNNATIFETIAASPEKTFRNLFHDCHLKIAQVFQQYYETRKCIVVQDTTRGYYLKRNRRSSQYSCVQGGTTATIVVILNGKRLISANAGDSSAILTGPLTVQALQYHTSFGPAYCSSVENKPLLQQITKQLQSQSLTIPKLTTPDHPATSTPTPGRSTSSSIIDNNKDNNCSNKPEVDVSDSPYQLTAPIVITGNHSAECLAEFERVQAFSQKCHKDGSVTTQPHVQFLYDHPQSNRHPRTNVFQYDTANEHYVLTTEGEKYYKNLRNEYASLVSTPKCAKFDDSLAFTRSLGDFHLHSYGVTFEPDIVEIDFQNALDATPGGENDNASIAIVVGTDGLWDTWTYSDVSKFVLSKRIPFTSSHSSHDSSKENSNHNIAKELIQINLDKAKIYFGDQADNMTAVICYLQCT